MSPFAFVFLSCFSACLLVVPVTHRELIVSYFDTADKEILSQKEWCPDLREIHQGG